MSPDIPGEKVDHRTDIFSFGVLLYEMVSGKRPFDGDTAIDVVAAVLTKDPPPLSQLDVPPALERIVARCLEKSPDKRFQSAVMSLFSKNWSNSNAPISADETENSTGASPVARRASHSLIPLLRFAGRSDYRPDDLLTDQLPTKVQSLTVDQMLAKVQPEGGKVFTANQPSGKSDALLAEPSFTLPDRWSLQ
jgi:serine/threonine protein kinase